MLTPTTSMSQFVKDNFPTLRGWIRSRGVTRDDTIEDILHQFVVEMDAKGTLTKWDPGQGQSFDGWILTALGWMMGNNKISIERRPVTGGTLDDRSDPDHPPDRLAGFVRWIQTHVPARHRTSVLHILHLRLYGETCCRTQAGRYQNDLYIRYRDQYLLLERLHQ